MEGNMQKFQKSILIKIICISFFTNCLFFSINLNGYAVITQTKKPIINTKKAIVKKTSIKKAVAKKTTKTPAKAPAKKTTKVPIKPVKKATTKTPSKTPSTNTAKTPNKDQKAVNPVTPANNNTTKAAVVTITPTVVPIVEKTVTINTMEDLFNYINTKSKDKLDFKNLKIEKTYNKAKEIIGKIIFDTMTDFEKEKIIHDYIVSNVNVSIENSDGKNSYEALVENNSGAFGYAESIKLLLNLSNIDCTIMNGTFTDVDNNVVKHDWDLVKIEGKYYHLDAAFDNNINISENANKDNYLTYNYFNVSDEAIESNHFWDRTKYEKAENAETDLIVKLLNDMQSNSSPVVLIGDWFYYANNLTNDNIAKCKFDGSSNVILYNDNATVSNIGFSKKWIVYSSDFIYKVNTETNERTNISASSVEQIPFDTFSVENDILYYLETENADLDQFNVYKMNVNGVEKTKVLDNALAIVNFFKVKSGILYYCSCEENNSGLFRINLLDKTTSKIINGTPVNIQMMNEWIYYTIQDVSTINDEAGLPKQTKTINTNYRTKYDGSVNEQIGEQIIEIKNRVD
jgi:transglutaminase/protease-like cytokinesis protein 3